MSERPVVALFASGHGFGHAVRSAQVAQALLDRGARVVLRSDAPIWLFPSAVELLPSPGWPVDVGVVQTDGLEMDITATRAQWELFGPLLEERSATEANSLREAGATVVAGDVPPLAFLAAENAGLPSAAIANFGWDWIYAGWEGFDLVIERIQRAYSAAGCLLRLPLHSASADAFPAFHTVRDVPLIGRRVQTARALTREALGLAPGERVVLLSFGGFHSRVVDPAALGNLPGFTFLLTSPQVPSGTLPGNVRLLDRRQLDYPALVAACDVVITKPGYGIVVDCLANRVAVLYTDRGPFREYPVLARALEELGRAVYVTQDAIRRGDLAKPLEKVLSSTREWAPLELGGARAVADSLLALRG